MEAARHLAASLTNLVRALEAYRLQISHSMGISTTALRALGQISERSPITPKLLASKLNLTTGTITPLLDSLEAAALVERVPNPSDRRSVHVRLSAKGEQTMAWAYSDLQAWTLRAIAQNQSGEANQLATWIDVLVDSLREF